MDNREPQCKYCKLPLIHPPPPRPCTQLYDHLPVIKKNSSDYKPSPNVLKLIIDSIYSIYYGVLKLNQNQ